MKKKTTAAVICGLLCVCPALGSPSATEAFNSSLDFRQIVRKAKNQVFPAVVFVRCIRENFDEGKRQTQEVSGSGVLISPRGEFLTNWHVVHKAIEVRCLLHDGRAFKAEVVGSDKDTDLALVKLDLADSADDLPYAKFGNSERLEEGEFVMAMGAPWGLSRSVSIGIISCTNRYLPDNSQYSLWLQTDCAISPGNSGGPLVNTKGEIVGINSRGYLRGGDMAFAVPSATARFISDQLREHGSVQWSWTGLQLQPLRDFNRNTYFDGTEGTIVAGTDKESPARRSGLQPRDRILRIGDFPADALTDEDLPAIRTHLGTLPIGESVPLTVLRNGQELSMELTPRKKGKVEGEEYDCTRWDFAVKTINQFDNPELHFLRPKGVFVYSVKYPGNAEDSLRSNDIILKIDSSEVKTLSDVERIHKASLESIGKKHKVVFTLLRNGLRRQVVVDFLRDYSKE